MNTVLAENEIFSWQKQGCIIRLHSEHVGVSAGASSTSIFSDMSVIKRCTDEVLRAGH